MICSKHFHAHLHTYNYAASIWIQWWRPFSHLPPPTSPPAALFLLHIAPSDIDFNETYSLVINEITFWYLIFLATQKRLSLQLMDVVTAYLCGSLDLDIYIKVSHRIFVSNTNIWHNMYCVKLNKSLYSLKQSGRMWYNRLKEFLLNKGYSNNDDCVCVFIHKSSTRFCIISVYVDDLNIISTELDINEARDYLKTEFKMKDLVKTNFSLGLQSEHLPTCILVHQSTYV
jgi:hypothetical protein